MIRENRRRNLSRFSKPFTVAACLLAPAVAQALEVRGQVMFHGLPVPGATITATQGGKSITTSSDANGMYVFADLPEGTWQLSVSMFGFEKAEQQITAASNMPGIRWELKMLPVDQMLAQTKVLRSAPAQTTVTNAPEAPTKAEAPKQSAEAPPAPKAAEDSGQANDGFLVNGSVNNAASSQFSLDRAFGNTRQGSKSLYTGGLGAMWGNSAFDARPYSLTGLDTPKPSYDRLTLIATLGGPLKIPHVMPHGPNFTVVYQWMRNSNATTLSGLVPTLAQRAGQLPTGPISNISPQAQALLALYPLPNLIGNANYNYQVPILTSTHQDAVQLRMDKGIGRRDQLFGSFAGQSTRLNAANLFGFVDKTQTLGLNANVTWSHRLQHGMYFALGYRFSRLRTLSDPYFAYLTNVSGLAGITGNDQEAPYWGPPTLVFSSGIASLTDGQSAFDRNRTEGIAPTLDWYRGRHNITIGGEFRRQEYNYLSQQNPRGTFTFTGAATGNSDFADFLTGVPDASTLAFGNADKYLRHSIYNVYGTDDWRLRPELTLNLGVRWEYEGPIGELKQRLVNLDVTSGFGAVAQVLASQPTGVLTGQHYPTSLLRPDRNNIEPRLGLSWRPIAASSLVVRAGYGVYADQSVYQNTALQMAQQAPLSKSVTVQRSAACPQTLASGFNPCSTTTTNTFAADPRFRVGYAQTWQLAVQRDLPAALQLTVTYLGIKGTRGVQDFLPNTYAPGATDPCQACPSGFLYRSTNGNSTREAGSVQLRRRLRSGFTATVLYTFSKSIDNDSMLGGQGPIGAGATTRTAVSSTVAQNWRDLRAERSLSSFDQRHLVTANVQYTSGMGLGGGTLLGGWRGRVLKEWTFVGQFTAGSGVPETPIYLAVVNGTGYTGSLRPDRTSVPVQRASVPGESGGGRHFLNANAFTAPIAGQWGNAGRNTITGPSQLAFDASLARTFRLDKRFNVDVRADATNLLNHVVFTAYNTTLNPTTNVQGSPAASSPLFGLPVATNPMRSMQLTARLRF